MANSHSKQPLRIENGSPGKRIGLATQWLDKLWRESSLTWFLVPPLKHNPQSKSDVTTKHLLYEDAIPHCPLGQVRGEWKASSQSCPLESSNYALMAEAKLCDRNSGQRAASHRSARKSIRILGATCPFFPGILFPKQMQNGSSKRSFFSKQMQHGSRKRSFFSKQSPER